ncbi:MAG: FG-GAP repeat domain-containing protein [Verrucomicrobiales bacterium]
MKDAPSVVAVYETPRTRPAITPAKLPGGNVVGLSAVNGELRCYDADGSMRWKIHPPGLNFTKIIACDDFDGDGAPEAAVEAERPTQPFGAASLVSLDDGRMLWRYDVEPMSYDWRLHVGRYLPGAAHPQLIVLMHGYPPDERKGYIALFDGSAPGSPPTQKWRHDFEVFTCFPSLLQTDLDGDGIDEIAVETHSHMWLFDARSGSVKQYLEWDVSPANVRSYGLVEFVDLNRDGRKDFLCLANFAKHFEVLLNDGGKLEKAWHHGWEDSVTTSKMEITWPMPPYGDVDGDGNIELVVSLFDVDRSGAWSLCVYDAITGACEARHTGMVAEALADANGDGAVEILARTAADRSVARPDGGHALDGRGGVHVLFARNGELKPLWSDSTAIPVRGPGPPRIQRGEKIFSIDLRKDRGPIESPWLPAPKPFSFDATIGADVATPPELLAADLIGDSRLEVILHQGTKVTLLRLVSGRLENAGEYQSSCQPAIGDLDGDGQSELILADIAPTHPASVQAITPSNANRVLWQTTLPPPLVSFPAPRLGYIRTGRFTGKSTADIYVCAGQPAFASVMLDGVTGKPIWTTGEFEEIDRPAGPTQNHAAAYDYDGDGKEDLVFTAPDYFCVLAGDAGRLLAGPFLPATIFHQPSQGLYTFPAILERPFGKPLVALVGGHYFQGVMSLEAAPLWHVLPAVGLARSGHEGFAQVSVAGVCDTGPDSKSPATADTGPDSKSPATADTGPDSKSPATARSPGEHWLMGFGRQNGRFVCVNVIDGSTRWEIDVGATCTDVATCDVDGDGAREFVFGTSHGAIYAIGDRAGSPRLLWKLELRTPLGPPILSDITGDGKSDIVVATFDGRVLVLGE